MTIVMKAPEAVVTCRSPIVAIENPPKQLIIETGFHRLIFNEKEIITLKRFLK